MRVANLWQHPALVLVVLVAGLAVLNFGCTSEGSDLPIQESKVSERLSPSEAPDFAGPSPEMKQPTEGTAGIPSEDVDKQSPLPANTSTDEGEGPRLDKLDALLTGVIAIQEDSQGEGEGLTSNGEYETTEQDLDSFPFHTDESGRVFVDVLIKTNGSLDGLDKLEVAVQNQVGSIVAARIPLDSLAQLTKLPNVEFIESARRTSIP